MTQLFAPVFFVTAGAAVDVTSLFSSETLPMIAILSVIAVVGKIVSGMGALRTEASKLSIGWGMVPRGEVGLIFASFGLQHGLTTPRCLFSSRIRDNDNNAHNTHSPKKISRKVVA